MPADASSPSIPGIQEIVHAATALDAEAVQLAFCLIAVVEHPETHDLSVRAGIADRGSGTEESTESIAEVLPDVFS